MAEGWDDWGPFYTPMYSQLVGLNGSTVEMCNTTGTACGVPGRSALPAGPDRLAERRRTRSSTSTLAFDIANRHDIIWDKLEIYRRGVDGRPRPACCPAPFDVANNWMHEYPKAYVIPVGAGQRSDAEANRLVEWLLFNGIEVGARSRAATFGGQTFAEGSYVVWMKQAHRGLADTALDIGDDISAGSASSTRRPAPGATASCGAPTSSDPARRQLRAEHGELSKPNALGGGVEAGKARTRAALRRSADRLRRPRCGS